ncbi:MAG TPA: DinB family protein [Rhodopila sp.]|nr:DinB family protein [Rhodopila sp.]
MLTDPDGLAELHRLGARSVPVLSRGDDWIFAQNIGHVVKFLGLDEPTGPVLSPDVLIQRLRLFLQTAIAIVPQMPDALLSKEVPNRPRSYIALAHHLFRIPEGMLEVAAGATLTNDMLTGGPAPGMATAADVAVYGQHVLDRLSFWWDTGVDHSARTTVQTYYGPQTLHELMERTTWHCGQHVRQWFMLLDMAGIAPATTLDAASFAGLPMPSSVWDG